MNKLQKEIDDITLMYKERDTKLKTYNGTLLGQIAGLKEENDKLRAELAFSTKVNGQLLARLREELDNNTKHPMYPIHWDSNIGTVKREIKPNWCYDCQYVTEQCKCNKEIE